MTKCAVPICRNCSAGSKRLAACAPDARAPTMTTAVSARTTPRRLSRLGVGVAGVTRRACEHEAEDEGRDAEEAGADEEQRVGLGQRAPDAQRVYPHARKSLGEL